MAVKFEAGEVRRGDMFFIDPSQLIVSESNRGRRDAPTREQVMDLALSILADGQVEPVEARRNGDKRLVLTFGFNRTAAVQLIREGFEDIDPETGAAEFHQVADFMLKVIVHDCNEEKAFERNIIENAQRNETSPIDDALNHQRLRDRYGRDDKYIASKYKYRSVGKVLKLRRLLLLDQPTQDRVHAGQMGVDAALAALDLPEDQRTGVIELATTGNGKVNGQVVREAVRKNLMKDDAGEASSEHANGESARTTKPKHAPSRSVRELRVFFEKLDHEDSDPAVRRFSKDILGFIAGSKSEKAMENAIDRLMDASRAEAVEV